MFNKNEWLKWAQNTQQSNADMKGFRGEYWRNNNPLMNRLYEDTGDETEKENKNAADSGPGPKDIEKKGKKQSLFKRLTKSELGNVGQQALAWTAASQALSMLSPSERRARKDQQRFSPSRVGTQQPQESVELGELKMPPKSGGTPMQRYAKNTLDRRNYIKGEGGWIAPTMTPQQRLTQLKKAKTSHYENKPKVEVESVELDEFEEPHMDPDEFIGVGNKGQDYHKYQRNPEDLRWKRAEIEVPEPKKKKVKRKVRRTRKLTNPMEHVEMDEATKLEKKTRTVQNRTASAYAHQKTELESGKKTAKYNRLANQLDKLRRTKNNESVELDENPFLRAFSRVIKGGKGKAPKTGTHKTTLTDPTRPPGAPKSWSKNYTYGGQTYTNTQPPGPAIGQKIWGGPERQVSPNQVRDVLQRSRHKSYYHTNVRPKTPEEISNGNKIRMKDILQLTPTFALASAASGRKKSDTTESVELDEWGTSYDQDAYYAANKKKWEKEADARTRKQGNAAMKAMKKKKVKRTVKRIVRDHVELGELSAKGWKNVATGAKAADAASTALTIGSLLAAPFTGGLSLAGLGAAAAMKGATKVGTTVAAKGATRMASKQAAKQAAKQATKQTLKQKAIGAGKQLAGDVATGAAMQAGMSAVTPKPKSPTTAVSTRPPMPAPATDVNYKKNIPVTPPPAKRRLAASYDPELVEGIFGALKGFRRTPKATKVVPGSKSKYGAIGNPTTFGHGSRLSRVGELAKRAGKGAIQYAKKLPGKVGENIPTALAFSAPSLLTPKPKDPERKIGGKEHQAAPPPRPH